jgi:hypothetical protein
MFFYMYLCGVTWLGFETSTKTRVLMWRACVIQALFMCQGRFIDVDTSFLRIFGGVTNFSWE